MAAKEISVKRYVVKLSVEEREHLEGLLRKGRSAARLQLKAAQAAANRNARPSSLELICASASRSIRPRARKANNRAA